MLSITAVIRAKPGEEAKLLAASLDVAVYIRANEPAISKTGVSKTWGSVLGCPELMSLADV